MQRLVLRCCRGAGQERAGTEKGVGRGGHLVLGRAAPARAAAAWPAGDSMAECSAMSCAAV